MKDYTINIVPRSVWQKPLHFIAFGFGSGAMPIMPGTFGTLIAIPFYLAIQNLSLWTYGLIVLMATLFGIWMCDVVSKEIGVHDHSGMVWDEIAGYGITMFAAPKGWFWIWLGFLLFRIFDIVKPGPIRTIDEKVSGGLGIMLDDIVAALCAAIVLQLIAHFIHL